jgi:DNA-binding CsgD family transcriptional regulator
VDLLETLVNKFPNFDPTWQQDAQSAWLSMFGRLLDLLCEKSQQPAPSVPTPSAHRYVVTPEIEAIMRQGAVDGLTNKQVAERTGFSTATVSAHMTRFRAEARTETPNLVRAAESVGAPPPNGAATPVLAITAPAPVAGRHSIEDATQRQMVALAEDGKTDSEIAIALELSALTVRSALKNWRKAHA